MGPDATFWEHEWAKHGTCALSMFPSEHKYFKTVLRMHHRYDLAVRPAAVAVDEGSAARLSRCWV